MKILSSDRHQRHLGAVRPLPRLPPPLVRPGLVGQLPLELRPRRGLVEHAHRVDGGHGPRPPHLVDAGRGTVAQGQPAVLGGHRHHPRRTAARVDPLTRVGGHLYFCLGGGCFNLQCGWRVAASGGTCCKITQMDFSLEEEVPLRVILKVQDVMLQAGGK